jgi:hypothetical protein
MRRSVFSRLVRVASLAAVFCAAFATPGFGQQKAAAHGLWVWKGPSIAEAPGGPEKLRDFCVTEGVSEVYLSVSAQHDPAADASFARTIGLLHSSGVRVEALISSTDADEPGPHRERLLDHARAAVQFNRDHPADRFDGMHLDIEPQQTPENKGEGNLGFLPNLVEAYRDVRAVAEPVHLVVNADIQNKLLKGDAEQRRMLLTSLPQFTLMLYELSSPKDGDSAEQQKAKLQAASRKYLEMAYDGLEDRNLAKLIIGLRTPDYLERLPQMLAAVDEANGGNSHYRGWARHSYGDTLAAAR